MLTLLLVMTLAGCGDLMFVEPLATDADTLFDTGFIGSWGDGDNTVVRVTGEHPPAYDVTLYFIESGKTSHFAGRMVRFGEGRQVLDLADPEPGLFNVGAHVWLSVDRKGDALSVSFLDSKWLQDQAKQAGLPAFYSEKHPVLTAPTAQLRSFAEKFGVRREARAEPFELKPFKLKKK